jgi:hypothetical protein
MTRKISTDRLKINPPLGNMPAVQYLLLGQLNIDSSYQRSMETRDSQDLVRRIAQYWNWDLCQPLMVSRRLDGALYVIDGQHRLAAAVCAAISRNCPPWWCNLLMRRMRLPALCTSTSSADR